MEGDDETSALEEKLDHLEDDLVRAMSQVKNNQRLIETYRQAYQDGHNWVDELIKQLDKIEMGNNIACAQKMETIQGVEKEFSKQRPIRFDAITQAKADLIPVISNIDAQQVEEQLKSVERRFNDVAKRIARKLQMVEATNNNLQILSDDIKNVHDWVKVNTEEVASTVKNTLPSESQLQVYKDLLKQTEDRQMIVDTLEKRAVNLQNELEPVEMMQLKNEIQIVKVDCSKLKDILKHEVGNCGKYLDSRKKFSDKLEQAKEKLAQLSSDIGQMPVTIPLPVAKVEAEVTTLKKSEYNLQQAKDTILVELNAHLSSLGQDGGTNATELGAPISEITTEFENLNQLLGNRLSSLYQALPNRRQYEEGSKSIASWLTQAEENMATPPIRPSNLLTMEEQLRKYQALGIESSNTSQTLAALITDADNEMKPTLSPADSEVISNELKFMKSRFSKIDDNIRERITLLLKYIQDYKDDKAKVLDCQQFMALVQAELKNLNRPVGNKIEDVQAMLSAYETILGNLKDSKAKMADVTNEHIPELQSLKQQQDDLINSIENQLTRLKQLLLLREQFIALINQIVSVIEACNVDIRSIEGSDDNADAKINKLVQILEKIQDGEALLASAADKGNKIASEGTAADKNTITDLLHSLKVQLQTARKMVDSHKQKLEDLMQEHKKMMDDLSKLLDDIHHQEAAIKSRPLLGRDAAQVDRELIQFSATQKKIERNLNELKKIDQQATQDTNILPGALEEMLSEARLLLQALPKELADLETYLTNHKTYRLEYSQHQMTINSWIDEADNKLQNKNGFNVRNISSEIEEHKKYFGGDSQIKSDLEQIQKEAVKIYPSLATSDQRQQSDEVNEMKRRVDEINTSANGLKSKLEEYDRLYKQFNTLYQSLREFLDRCETPEGGQIDNSGALNFIQQRTNQLFNEIQVSGNVIISVFAFKSSI